MSTEIDRDQWSESSKRSYVYHYQRRFYDDIHYICRRCQSPSVFTAADQKIAFEVKKHYIWQRRTLCGDCNAGLFALRVLHRELETRWASQKVELSGDLEFLEAWHMVLSAFPEYGSRVGGAMGVKVGGLIGLLRGRMHEGMKPLCLNNVNSRGAP
jgi:Probable zinc-ribbon domain